jgi:protein-S-isoprenylcysteine O-methyltransferase Ste14
MNSKKSRPLPPTYLLVGLLAMLALHLVYPGAHLIKSLWRLLGLMPLALGLVLNLWADRLFKRYGTEVRPFRESTTLVLDGPFRITRNPMYLGGLFILVGAGILLGSTAPFVVVPLLFRLVTVHFVRPEEDAMERQFGARFSQYKSKVPRWL